jgi:hypothetical protein
MAKLKRWNGALGVWEYLNPATLAGTPGPQGAPGTQGATGTPGPQGTQGPQGSSFTGYTHTQTLASDTWVINHGLNRRPLIASYEDTGTSMLLVHGSITFTDLNTLSIKFSTPISGEANLL